MSASPPTANSAGRIPAATGDVYLAELATLGAELAQTVPASAEFFSGPLRIVQAAMGFTLSVVYRVQSAQGGQLVLDVVDVLDPMRRRPEIATGTRVAIDLAQPGPIFRNEAQAFRERGVAAVNVPGVGCDIAGYVSAGDAPTDAFLLAGDFVGAEADLRQADIRVFTIATGMLSALLTKAHYQQRADHDRLTGLLSAARIRSELEQRLRGARTPNRIVTVVLADLDDFKRINDTHGHLQGDAVLSVVGRLIAGSVRDGDRVGRFGGEEFLLVLDHGSPGEPRAMLEQLRRNVEQHVFGDPAGPANATFAVTISIGACLIAGNQAQPDPAEVLARADRALYAAKLGGRNQVVMVGPDTAA